MVDGFLYYSKCIVVLFLFGLQSDSNIVNNSDETPHQNVSGYGDNVPEANAEVSHKPSIESNYW